MRLSDIDNEVPANDCPSCGKNLDIATSIDGDFKPRVGDLTVCIKCAAFLVFGEDFSLRLITPEEMGGLEDDTRITLLRTRKAIKTIKAIKGD